MNNNQLNQNPKRRFSSKKKSIVVEEIRSGMLSNQQSTRQYQLTGSVLQRWNRWYFKTRLLKYVQPLAFSPMKLSEDELKQQLMEAQAQLEQLKLKNAALETMTPVTIRENITFLEEKAGPA